MINQYELNTVEQLKEQLFKAVTQAIHDIQSPLSSLLMMCMATNKTYNLSPNDLKTRIIGILKSIIQPVEEATDKTITDGVIDVPQVIEKIIAEKECEYANLPITFKSNIHECKNAVSILGNIDDFNRMLSNLINNAVEAFANKPGVITINCDCADGKLVRVTIEDNGQGMPEEIKNRILNNERVTDKTHGQGLGFTHTRETLAKCGGKLDIESKPGHGTKIILTLPYTNVLPKHNQISDFAGTSGKPPIVTSSLKQVDIVIVEDDKDHTDILATFMFKGKKSDVFNSAKEFLENYKKYPLDTIMLVDYQFPEENINGIDVYKELYANGFTNCYLYSGMEFEAGELPSYIKAILKTDLDAIKALIR